MHTLTPFLTFPFTRSLVGLAIAGSVFIANEAPAVPIASEDFQSYSANSDLNGQSGGAGWSTTWTASTAFDIVVDPGTALSGSDGTSGGNRALRIGDGTTQDVDDNDLLRRDVAAGSDPYYFSFLLRTNAVNSDFLAFWFDDGPPFDGTTHSNDAPNVGVLSAAGGVSTIFARMSGDNTAGAGAPTRVESSAISSGTDYLVVAQIFKSDPGATNEFDRVSLWVNPSASTSPIDGFIGTATIDASQSTAGLPTSISTFGVRTVNNEAGDQYLIDNLKIGTTWNDVVAVPEPSTLASAVLGAGLLLARRRRRSIA